MLHTTFKTFGWFKNQLDQISRIEGGLMSIGCVFSHENNVDFIYCHDGSQYNEAISFHKKCLSLGHKTKLLLKVLDLPTHLRSDFTKEKEILKNADLILANSRFVQSQIKNLLGYDSVVVYDAMHNVNHLPYIPKTFNFLMVGRVHDANKRAILAKELVELRNDADDKLICVGPEFFGFNIEGKTHSLGVQEVRGLETFYNNAKYTLCFGKVEGLSLVPFEASASGSIPIVTNDTTTASEFIPEIFQCEPNAVAINEKIKEFDSDYKKYKDIALSFGEACKERFNATTIAKNILAAYHSINV